MQVTFRKREDKGRRLCQWDALIGKRTRVPGTVMGVGHGLPHDLVQYVVEASADVRLGFWALLARGATYKSTGRKRTRPGRAVIASNRAGLLESERIAGEHLARWKTAAPTPAAHALDTALEQWNSLRTGDVLVFEWPSATGDVIRR